METKHTPEPWGAIWVEGEWRVDHQTPRGARDIAKLYLQSNPYEAEANARRIVACVNACAGLSDPSAVPELVEALEEVMAWFDLSEVAHFFTAELGEQASHSTASNRARAAIAKVKGENNDNSTD